MPKYLASVEPFCEGTYIGIHWPNSNAISEIGNSLSSLFITLWGLCGLFANRDAQAGMSIQILNGTLAIVGLGSCIYHSTLFFGTGLLDSVPMTFLVAVSAMAIGDEMLYELTDRRSKLRWIIGNTIVLLSLGYFFILVSLDATGDTDLWRILFAFPSILLLSLLVYVRYRDDYFLLGTNETIQLAKILLRSGAWSGLIGTILWQLDQIYCNQTTVYLFGHVWWHTFIGHAAHMLFAFLSYLRAHNYEKVPIIEMYPTTWIRWPLLAVVKWQPMDTSTLKIIREQRSKSMFFGKPGEYGQNLKLAKAQSTPTQPTHLDVPQKECRRFSTGGMHYGQPIDEEVNEDHCINDKKITICYQSSNSG